MSKFDLRINGAVIVWLGLMAALAALFFFAANKRHRHHDRMSLLERLLFLRG
jgi:hypothetical protein